MPRLEIDKLTDITSRKHRGNEQSRTANQNGLSTRASQRATVLQLIQEAGPRGLCMKEIAALLGVPFNACSGRGSELKRFGQVEETGEVRQESAVLCAVAQPQAVAARDKSGDALVSPTPQQTPISHPSAKFSAKNDEKPIVIEKTAVKPLSPSQVHKELKALADLWNSCRYDEMSDDTYEQARKVIFERGRAWGK